MATEYLSDLNENQVNSQPIIKEIIQEEKIGEKQKKGLNNSGNSSFINSVIHCLSTYKEFIKMFLNENIKDFLEKHKLLQGLKDILLFLYDKNQEKIRNKLLEDWRLNFCELIPKYKDKDKHDPLEFILDLLNTISNIINENISSVPEIWKYSEDINEINFGDNLIRESWVRQTNKDKSKINELFGGLITTEVSCAFCNYKDTDKSSKNEPFVLLDFPIPDVLTMKVKIIYLDKGAILRDTIEIHINDCLTVKQLKILCKQNMNQLLINDNIEMRAILISGNSCKGIHTKMVDDEDILYHSKSLEYLSADQIDLKSKEVYIVMAQKYVQEEKQKNLDDSLNQVFDEYNSSNSIRSSLASFASSFISISSDHSHSSIINKYLIVIPFRYIEKEASGCGREQRVLRSYECSNYPFVFNICIQKNENNKLDIKELLVKIGAMLYPKTDISEHLKLENKPRIEFFFLSQLSAKQFDDHYDEKNIIHELKKFFKSSSSKQFCLFYEEKREYGKVFEPNFPVLNLQENIDLNTCFKVWRDNPNEYQKCIKCNHLLNIKSTLSKIPRFLCIYLNRFSIKKNKRTENTRIVSIEEEFNIQPFTYHKLINEEYKSMYNKKDCKYKLIAVNQHFTSFFKENYVALNKLNDTWYSFEDDKKIKELTFDKISSPKTIMLFYERVQTDEDKNDNANIINS